MSSTIVFCYTCKWQRLVDHRLTGSSGSVLMVTSCSYGNAENLTPSPTELKSVWPQWD